MTALIVSAHSDDEIIGVGGTIAKLSKEEDVYVLIFKYGADLPGILTSWPFMNQRDLRKKRIIEAKRADEFLGVKRTIFLGLEGDMSKNWNASHQANLIRIIKEINPDKVFFHSSFDLHKDHLFVNKKMVEILNSLNLKLDVYTYEINLWRRNVGEPKVVIDITKFFKKKMKALNYFKSQILSIMLLKPLIIWKSIEAGKMIGVRYGEVFYRK